MIMARLLQETSQKIVGIPRLTQVMATGDHPPVCLRVSRLGEVRGDCLGFTVSGSRAFEPSLPKH